MSVRTSYRRAYNRAVSKMQRQLDKATTGCTHSKVRWTYMGRYAYRVCTECGEILQKVSR